MTSLISIDNLDNYLVRQIIQDAKSFKNRLIQCNYKSKIYCIMFFEPSTRTNLSFQTAINKLDAKMIFYDHNMSSSKKGESINDTIKTIENYCDAIIIRHPDNEIVKQCADISQIPVINAGNGSGEHPTQALLDLYTILEFNDDVNNAFQNSKSHFFSVTFTGDLKNSRTVHSLVKLLDKLFLNITFYFVSSEKLKLTDDFKSEIKNIYYEVNNLQSVIGKSDVLYMTRIQKERENNEFSDNVCLTQELLNNGKESLIVLHPLPRNNEISEELDNDRRCKYFEQVKNGVYIRMSVLKNCLQ